jgi:hypothetical protein
MIDLETARKNLMERVLLKMEPALGTRAIVDDAKTEEHEWGWMFYWHVEDPNRVPPEHAGYDSFPILVDRVTGFVELVGNGGPRMAVFQLLESRKKAIEEERVPGDGA